MAAAIRVLCVDDDPLLLEVGTKFLEKSGDFTVTTATSASDAIRLLEQETFDTIVSDYQMPEMDGIQFLVEVRTKFGEIPFILFTGKGREEVVIKALNAGADGYLQKGGEPSAQFAELAHKIKVAASRKRVDDALRTSEEKYRHLIEHADEAIVVVQEGMVKLVNHRTVELTGHSKQELLSASISTFVHPDDRAMVMERYQKRMKGEESPSRYSFRLSPKDGSTRWVEISISAIDWEEHPATLNFLTDITERKKAEDTLALTARKLTLMNDVTYQYIQNKVTAVRGYAELSKDVKTKAERLSFIEKEEHILADIHHLIKNTREYQEIGLLLPQWIPVERSVRIAVSLVSPRQEISIETALHGLELYTDPLIEKIIANLIENAVIHGKTTRHITFSCKEMVDGLTLICEDDGVGISPEIKVHLFERSVGENIHFGLFFVRECLLLSGMTIAETGEPGKGARFEITVPKGAYRFTGTGG